MKNFEEIGRSLERSGKADKIKQLADSADGQKISRMIDAKAMETAARNGDSQALKSMLGAVLSTDEGKRLAQELNRMMQDK